MERRLRRGIASAARRGWLPRQAPVDTCRERRWQIAIAASAVLSLGIVLSLVVPHSETTVPGKRLFADAGEQRIASTRTVRLGSVRGTGGVPDVSIVLTEAPSELVIEPDVVVLTCPDGAIETRVHRRQRPKNAAVRRVRNGPGQTPWRHTRVAFVAPVTGGAHAAVVHAA